MLKGIAKATPLQLISEPTTKGGKTKASCILWRETIAIDKALNLVH